MIEVVLQIPLERLHTPHYGPRPLTLYIDDRDVLISQFLPLLSELQEALEDVL